MKKSRNLLEDKRLEKMRADEYFMGWLKGTDEDWMWASYNTTLMIYTAYKAGRKESEEKIGWLESLVEQHGHK